MFVTQGQRNNSTRDQILDTKDFLPVTIHKNYLKNLAFGQRFS